MDRVSVVFSPAAPDFAGRSLPRWQPYRRKNCASARTQSKPRFKFPSKWKRFTACALLSPAELVSRVVGPVCTRPDLVTEHNFSKILTKFKFLEMLQQGLKTVQKPILTDCERFE